VQNPVTPEETWLQFLNGFPAWQVPSRPTVVVSPHPDDETLSAGGLIALQRRAQLPVSILAVTDGEAAYRDQPHLGETRAAEQQAAAQALGVAPEQVFRLRLPDSRVSRFEDDLADRIAAHLATGTLLIANWPHDPHPDHEACGRAALRAADRTGASLAFCFFWTWHQNRPDSLAHLPLRRLELSDDLQQRRADALACHRTQLQQSDGEPVLPELLLKPARRNFETYLLHD